MDKIVNFKSKVLLNAITMTFRIYRLGRWIKNDYHLVILVILAVIDCLYNQKGFLNTKLRY